MQEEIWPEPWYAVFAKDCYIASVVLKIADINYDIKKYEFSPQLEYKVKLHFSLLKKKSNNILLL